MISLGVSASRRAAPVLMAAGLLVGMAWLLCGHTGYAQDERRPADDRPVFKENISQAEAVEVARRRGIVYYAPGYWPASLPEPRTKAVPGRFRRSTPLRSMR
jgi:hypothetical protein